MTNDLDPRELNVEELEHVAGGAAPTDTGSLLQMLSQVLQSMSAATDAVIRNLK